MDVQINELIEQAKVQYQKLTTPKIISEELYIKNWIYSVNIRNTAEVELKNINPSDYQKSIDFFLIYPPEFQTKLQNEIWKVKPETRTDIWNKLQIPYEKIEKSFVGLINQRNNSALSRGYKTSVDFYLHPYHIPKSIFKNFIKNIDKIIEICNKQLKNLYKFVPNNFYAEFNNPCYVCLLNDFPFKNLNEVKNYIFKKNDLLNKYKNKIDFIFGDYCQSIYKKETDRFEVQIDKRVNLRHQSIDLIHELSHVVNRIKCYKLGFLPEEKGPYFNEFEATKLELDFLKEISQPLYNAIFGEFLKVFRRVLFEIEIYQKPNQNLDKVYALIFNKCFKNANQTRNRSFILDNNIINHPFSNLPHALAQFTLIQKLLI